MATFIPVWVLYMYEGLLYIYVERNILMCSVGITNANQPVFTGEKAENKSNILGKTVVAAGTGAILGAGIEAGSQTLMLKSPATKDKFIKILTDRSIETKSPKFKEYFSKTAKDIEIFAEKGKLDYKTIGKNAGIGAATIAGLYLLCKGVGALFSGKEKDAEQAETQEA